MDEEQYEATRESALRSLGARAFSVHELQERLLSKGFDEESVFAVTARFQEVGLLNDSEYAQLLVRVGFRERHHGRHRIWADLQRRGIPPELATAALAEYQDTEEDEAAAQAAAKAARRYQDTGSIDVQRKIYAALRRRGFNHNVSQQAVSKICRQNMSEGVELDTD